MVRTWSYRPESDWSDCAGRDIWNELFEMVEAIREKWKTLEEAEEEFEAARAAQEEARANRFNPLTGSFYGEADDTEAENPAESLEINEGEEIPAEGDDSDENCPDEDDEDVMPESWEQDDDEEEEAEPADESPEDEETEE